MKAFNISFADRIKKSDLCLIVCSTLLSCVSLLLMFSIRDAPLTSGIALFRMQAAATAVGIVCMLFLSTVDLKRIIDKVWIPLIIAEIGILGITVLYGKAQGANTSWLKIGPVILQPSEFVKLSYIITFSKHLETVKGRINHPLQLLLLALHAGAVIGAILLSGDLGVALVYVGFTAIMLYASGLSLFYFLGAGGAAVIAFPYVWPHLREDQQKRIIYGFHPEDDPLDKGLQPLTGRSCVINGGLFGKGLNGGSQYKTLYACENDFSFSTLCEKFGIITGILVLICLFIITIRLFRIAATATYRAGSFICIGIAGAIIIQTAENVGMCLALLPVVGITLPFISYGGSATFSIYLMMGVAHSVAAHRDKPFFETLTD